MVALLLPLLFTALYLCFLNSTNSQASQSLSDRADQLMASYNEIERSLQLIGATGIEDKLQDGVPETIASLREANIKVSGSSIS